MTDIIHPRLEQERHNWTLDELKQSVYYVRYVEDRNNPYFRMNRELEKVCELAYRLLEEKNGKT